MGTGGIGGVVVMKEILLYTVTLKHSLFICKKLILQIHAYVHLSCAEHPCSMRVSYSKRWNAHEDRILFEAKRARPKSSWRDISTFVPGRSAKQCGERWRNFLDPKLTHGQYTAKEDHILLTMHQKFGNKWATIARAALPRRTAGSLKNRYKTLCRHSLETTVCPRMKHVATQCEAIVPRYPSFSVTDADAQELITAAFPLLLTLDAVE